MALETTGNEAGLKARGHVPSATRIGGNTRANVTSLWFFAVLWNLVSAPILVFIPPELARQPLAALGFLFPVVGVGLICWAVVTTARARRFGDTWLDSTAGGARPGSSWHATVGARLPRADEKGHYTVSVKLTCLHRTISRHGDDRDERERILWREEAEFDATRIAFDGEHASIPVRFDIPADAQQTTAVGKGEGVLWVLTVEAALPGVNLKEDFDVPVLMTSGADTSDPTLPTKRTATTVGMDDLARTGIMVEPSENGMRFTFAPMRNVSFAASVTALTAVFIGALWIQLYVGFPWIFAVVTGLVDLLLVYVVIDLWLGTTVVVAGRGTLRVRHTVLGAGSSRTLLAAEIASIELHISMQTQGRYGTPYYDVRARLKSGRKVTLGGGVRNKRHAEWLAAQMRSAMA